MMERLLKIIECHVRPVQLDPDKIKKVLIVDLNFMGDMLMSSPAVRLFKKHLPCASVDVLAYDFCRPVLEKSPFIDRIWTVKKNAWGAWWAAITARLRGYDLVMQFNTSLKTNAMLFVAGQTRLGYNFRHRGCLLNVRIPIAYRTARHGARIEECCDLLCEAFGWDDPVCSAPVLCGGMPEHYIVFCIAPGDQKRQWGRFHELADRLCGNGTEIVFSGAQKDRNYVWGVIGRMQNSGKAINLCGRTDVEEMIRVLRGAKFLVTVNTFTLHVAVIHGIKTVAIIGGTPASVVLPFATGHVRPIEDPGLKEYNPETGDYPVRINEITVEQVLEQVGQLGN